MDWMQAPWIREVAAIATAALLLWRFERMVKQQTEATDRARSDFLTALEKQRAAAQEFQGNHQSADRKAIERATEALGHVCERLAAVETRVSECPTRTGREAIGCDALT